MKCTVCWRFGEPKIWQGGEFEIVRIPRDIVDILSIRRIRCRLGEILDSWKTCQDG